MNPFTFLHLPEQALTNLNFGDIVPAGWLKHQVEYDLVHGFVGHLDQLAPNVMMADDIYGRNRRTRLKQDAGRDVSPNALSWWNSESQGNWWDGYIRSALLVENPRALEKTEQYIRSQLTHQDDDGYMGIYAPDLRFQKGGENTDFWAQTTLIRGLLAYYEKTRNPQILDAIQKAVKRSMAAYPPNKSTPFKNPADGHSLAFTDILDRLHQLTGNEDYLKYALFLYENYNTYRDDDLLVKNLMDKNYKFTKHGVHIYELFRSLITAYFASGNPVLEAAIQQYLAKLDVVITPSGGPIGDEWVEGRIADASEVGYEYCSIHELLDSYSLLMQKMGDLSLGDRIEWLFYNAGQGARHPEGHGIAYLKTDNSYTMTGPLHPGDNKNAKHPQWRYKYSPVHQDVAVCCVPNAGRIYPYFIRTMWMRTHQGLMACLFGPSILTTEIDGIKLSIHQITRYPFDHSVKMVIRPEHPVSFELTFRIPGWADGIKLNGQPIPIKSSRRHSVQRDWHNGDTLSIEFLTDSKMHFDMKGNAYLSYGPLVFAYPLKGKEKIAKSYPLENFNDLHYTPVDIPKLRMLEDAVFKIRKTPYRDAHPWNGVFLDGSMYDKKTGRMVEVNLVPLGATILRQLTFPVKVAGNSIANQS